MRRPRTIVASGLREATMHWMPYVAGLLAMLAMALLIAGAFLREE
jgi:hypothetical protein